MPRGLAAKTIALIATAYDILSVIQPTTVRSVCYQLFNRKLIPDMSKKSTDRVSKALKRTREQGLIPWEWIVDEGRQLEHRPGWRDPEAYMRTVIRSYRKNRWAAQPERVIVVSEKGTVGGVLRSVIDEWGVPFGVYHGYSSATAIHDLAEQSLDDSRPLTILYVGDHDPSGRNMSDVDLLGRLDRYGGDAQIKRIAVTPEQIRTHNLLTFSAQEKQKDARYAWFVERFGDICCELDALDPTVLRDRVSAAIADHVDLDAWERADEIENVEMKSLSDFLATWPGAA